jgi:hypothetical protein
VHELLLIGLLFREKKPCVLEVFPSKYTKVVRVFRILITEIADLVHWKNIWFGLRSDCISGAYHLSSGKLFSPNPSQGLMGVQESSTIPLLHWMGDYYVPVKGSCGYGVFGFHIINFHCLGVLRNVQGSSSLLQG